MIANFVAAIWEGRGSKVTGEEALKVQTAGPAKTKIGKRKQDEAALVELDADELPAVCHMTRRFLVASFVARLIRHDHPDISRLAEGYFPPR